MVHSIKDDIPSGNFQHIFEAITDTIAQQHSLELSEDVKRGQHHLVETFGALGGVPPRGFKREPVQISTHRDGKPHITHKWVPDPDLVPLVKKAWQMRAAGASLAAIKKETNLYKSTNGFTTFFRNKLYIGIMKFGDLTIENYCEPVIDKEIWDAVQKSNTKYKKVAPEIHPRRKNSIYLLSGLLYCAKCGSPYNGHAIASRDGNSYRYYRCSKGHRNRDCDAPYINKEDIEKAILEEICNHILDPDHLKMLQDQAKKDQSQQKSVLESEVKVFRSELGRLKLQINNVTKAIAEAGHSQALLQRLETLETRKVQIETKIAEMEANQGPPAVFPDPEEIGRTLSHVLQAAPKEEKQIILRGLIHRIDALRDKKENKIHGTIIYYLPSGMFNKKKAPRKEELSGEFYVYRRCPHGDSNPGFSLERAMS